MARAELFERLGPFALTPRTVLDIGGALTGDDAGRSALRALFPRARFIATRDPATRDPSAHDMAADGPALRDPGRATRSRALAGFAALRRLLPGAPLPVERLVAPPDRLPLADGSVDLALGHWLSPGMDALDAVLAELRRTLAPGGLFLWTTPGLGAAAEPIDLHDLGSALARAGFAEPVLDVDRHRAPTGGGVLEVIHAAAFAGAPLRGTQHDPGDAASRETLIPPDRIGRRRGTARDPGDGTP
jgi:malonyl-CoA O-methyltransferase